MRQFDDCDFVVLVRLNRGNRYRQVLDAGDGKRQPDLYVVPTDVARLVSDPKSKWGRLNWTQIPELEKYRENWQLVRNFLAHETEN